MGNCIVLQGKPVRVMKTDGKIIEYKNPVKVHQVLSEHSHHAISDRLPVVNHLHPSTEMLQGHLYYLLPLPVVTPQLAKKKKQVKKAVRFSDEVLELEEAQQGTEVVRIKLVISKQELLAMIGKEGVLVEDIVSQVHKDPTMYKIEDIHKGRNPSSKKWPLATLEAIQEVN